MSKEKSNKKANKEVNKKQNKLYFIIAILLIAIVISFIVFITQTNIDYELEEVGEYQYLKLYENGKYGIIDRSGNILIKAQYEQINIPNPSKPIFICYESENKTKVLNEKNEQLFTKYEEVLPLIFKEFTSEIPFEKSVLQYKKDGKYGLIDFQGNEITSAKYDSIESLLYKEGCLLVKQNDKVGLINIKGKEIIKPEYYSIEADGYYNEESKYKAVGFVVCNKTSEGYRYGYINSKAEIILEPIYNAVQRVTEIIDDNNVYLVIEKNGQAGLTKNKDMLVECQNEEIEYNRTNEVFAIKKALKYGVIDKNGKSILPIEYDDLWFISKNINVQKGEETQIYTANGEKVKNTEYSAIIETENEEFKITIKDQKYGVINSKETSIIDNKYQYIEYVYGDYFIVTNNDKVGVLNSKADKKIDFEYSVIQKVRNTNVLQAINTDTKIIDFYNINMEKVYTVSDAIVYAQDDYIKILSDNDRKYLDNNGKEISSKEIFKNNKLFAVSKSEDETGKKKWGFSDSSDNVIVEIKYDMVTEFNEYGFAGIEQDGKWGVVDKDGKVIVEPKYENIDWGEPEFVNKYCKLNFGYGFEYYTDEI